MPTDLNAWETRGLIYLKLGDPVIAIREYDAALQVDPNRPLAFCGRGLAKASMGHAKQGGADRVAAGVPDPSIESQFSSYGL